MIDAFCFWTVLGQVHTGIGQQFTVERCECLTLRGPFVEVLQLHIQHCRLEAIHAVVVTNIFVNVSYGFAVAAQCAGQLRNFIVVGGERATFAVCA